MKKLLLVSVSTIVMAGAAHANEIIYSSQGGQNALNTSISGYGNTIGKAAPRSTSSYSRGSKQTSASNWTYYSYYRDWYRYTTDVNYIATRSTSFPTDYSAAKQVGNNNVATTNQRGTENSLNFSQGSDTVYTETYRKYATGSNRKFDWYYNNRASDYNYGRDTNAEARFNQTDGYYSVYQRGAVTAAQDNTLNATQSGEYNNAVLNQLGDHNYAYLYQSGTSNNADLLQSSDGSDANVQQYGAGNNAVLRQYSTSQATLYQSGADNTATILQGNNGGSQYQSNSVNIRSSGRGNSVYAVQAGYYGGNTLSVSQNGTNNSSNTRQTGSRSAIKLTQHGDNNNFSATQTARGKVMTVNMVGNGGNINLYQN